MTDQNVEDKLTECIDRSSNKINIFPKMVRRKTELEEQISGLENDNCKLRTEQEANLLAVTERDQKVCALVPGISIAL